MKKNTCRLGPFLKMLKRGKINLKKWLLSGLMNIKKCLVNFIKKLVKFVRYPQYMIFTMEVLFFLKLIHNSTKLEFKWCCSVVGIIVAFVKLRYQKDLNYGGLKEQLIGTVDKRKILKTSIPKFLRNFHFYFLALSLIFLFCKFSSIGDTYINYLGFVIGLILFVLELIINYYAFSPFLLILMMLGMPADSEFNNYAVAPVTVQFNFTKKLEGRELKAGEFSFVLKDEKGNVIETVANDASGKIKFSALTFKNGEEGTYIYHVEEVKGTEAGIEYDHMIATVGIKVKKDGRVLIATTELPADTEFNNKVTPPTPPTPVVPPITPPTPPTPVVPPVTPPTPPTPGVQTVKSVTSLTPVTYEGVKEQELPKTGDNKSEVAIEVGGLLTLVGLVLSRKRKNNS